MTYKEAISYIKSDLSRYNLKRSGGGKFLRAYLFEHGFRFSFWFRLACVHSVIRPFFWLIYKHYSTLYGIQIPTRTKIGKGFYLGHGLCVVINPTAVIGNNVNIGQFTTIGSSKGKAATIEDGVWIGPGCCIVEDVHIGKNSVIGAGSVVVKDVPENTVSAGSPAKVIRYK